MQATMKCMLNHGGNSLVVFDEESDWGECQGCGRIYTWTDLTKSRRNNMLRSITVRLSRMSDEKISSILEKLKKGEL